MSDNSILEKISSAAGVIFDPEAPKRRAEAEAEAMRVKAEGEKEAAVIKAEGEREARVIEAQGKREAGMIESWGKLTPAEQRAWGSIIGQQMKYQANIENIAEEARPLIDEGANPKNIGDTWTANFYDKAKGISDEEMWQLWAGILAGEINNPGSFSKRAVNILAELSREDVLLFENLCSFGWRIEGKLKLIIFDYLEKIYINHGINFNALLHLESLGFIKHAMENTGSYLEVELPETTTAVYSGKTLLLSPDEEKHSSIPLGIVLLTTAGEELAQLTDPSPVDGFYDYAEEQWKKHGYIPPGEIEWNPSPTPKT